MIKSEAFRDSVVLSFIVLSYFCLVALGVFVMADDLVLVQDAQVMPKGIWDLFFHNAFFVLTYLVPIVGPFHCFVSFTYIGIMYGYSFLTFGFNNIITHMAHIPLEIWAFAIPIVLTYRSVRQKHDAMGLKLKLMLLSFVVLFVSAIIEMRFGGL